MPNLSPNESLGAGDTLPAERDSGGDKEGEKGGALALRRKREGCGFTVLSLVILSNLYLFLSRCFNDRNRLGMLKAGLDKASLSVHIFNHVTLSNDK